ncbi:hypothetical protein [Methanoregula sp.]|uniref:hypothetical protein n=1 Tax=Methanoregula sp. TaxID=2052170 RepID=UPI003BB1E8DB
MRPGHHRESGVATLIEYLMVSGVLMVLFVIMMLLVNANIMEGPADALSYYAFTDIGNGVSTRIVEVYSIAPQNGTITTNFDIPADVGEQGYFVQIQPSENLNNQNIEVWRDAISSNISLAGIDLTQQGVAIGNTTSGGINTISYNSNGF